MNPIPDKGVLAGTPLVSVALCTFNGAAFIRVQLDSLLSQTYTNLQIVIIDDCSTDETATIIREYAAKDSRISFTANIKNLGFNKNFEKAIGLCIADFIAPCDQDDIWENNKIEAMMNDWPADSLFIYSLSGNFFGDDFKNREPAPGVVYKDIDDVRCLVFNSPVHGHACMFRKILALVCMPFPKDIFYDWWISMYAAVSGTIGCVPLTLTWHRHHENNSSRNIMSIKDEKKRDEALRQQSVYFIETFCSRSIIKNAQKNSLVEYAGLLKQLDGKRFSWPMFRYVLKNRKYIFHYKKPGVLRSFSFIKHSFKMAYRGLL